MPSSYVTQEVIQARLVNHLRRCHCLHRYVQTCCLSVIRNSVLTSAAAFFWPQCFHCRSTGTHCTHGVVQSQIITVNELWTAQKMTWILTRCSVNTTCFLTRLLHNFGTINQSSGFYYRFILFWNVESVFCNACLSTCGCFIYRSIFHAVSVSCKRELQYCQ